MAQLTRRQVREVDRLAIEELRIPGVVLMENAGRNAASVVLEILRTDCGVDPAAGHVTVLCGGGNNGGDGYVIARHLHNAGVTVVIYSTADPAKLTGDAAVNHSICAKMGLLICPISTSSTVYRRNDQTKGTPCGG